MEGTLIHIYTVPETSNFIARFVERVACGAKGKTARVQSEISCFGVYAKQTTGAETMKSSERPRARPRIDLNARYRTQKIYLLGFFVKKSRPKLFVEKSRTGATEAVVA